MTFIAATRSICCLGIFSLAVLGPSSSLAAGDAKHPVEVESEGCMGKATTTIAMQDCLSAEYAAWDVELNRLYQQLMATLPTAARESLRAAQRLWIKYRDAEFEFVEKRQGPVEERGSMSGIMILADKNRIARDRVLELDAYLQE